MNNKLKKQLSQIFGATEEETMSKRTTWMQHYVNRQQFLRGLLADMATTTFKTPKEKSRYYSNALVNYDVQFVGGL